MAMTWSCLSASAHDYWLDPGDFRPATGAKAKILLCSGHSFPKMTADAHGHGVNDAIVVEPGGNAVPLTIDGDDESKWAKFDFRTNGTYIVCLSVAGAKKEEPTYWARALVIVGSAAGAEHALQTGKGMEIVPGAGLPEVAVNDSLPLSVAFDGRAIRALVTITREDGTVSHIRSSPRRPALLKIKKPGKYLVVASVAGKKCSLTFSVAETGTSNSRSGHN